MATKYNSSYTEKDISDIVRACTEIVQNNPSVRFNIDTKDYNNYVQVLCDDKEVFSIRYHGMFATPSYELQFNSLQYSIPQNRIEIFGPDKEFKNIAKLFKLCKTKDYEIKHRTQTQTILNYLSSMTKSL